MGITPTQREYLNCAMMEPLVIYPNTSRLNFYAVGMGLMLALSAVIMFSLERVMLAQLRIATLVVAFLGCVSFGYAMLYFIMRASQKPPLLRGDAEGLHFDVNYFNKGSIEWSNIQDYSLAKHAGRTLLLINLKDPFALIDAHSGLQRRLLKGNLKRYRTPVAIPAALIEGDAVAVANRVAEFGRRNA